MIFNSALGLKLNPDQIAKEIIDFIKVDPKREYKVIIGTDSESFNELTDFVTAIIVYRKGNGGRYFWRRQEFKNIKSLRQKIIQEVMISLETAQIILKALKNLNSPQFDFEIHVDIGKNGQTKAMISEVVSMIRAYNFSAKTKPESYAASTIADRHL